MVAENGFSKLMDVISSLSKEDIFSLIIETFNKFSDIDKKNVAGYFTTYPFWGSFDPENGNYEALRERARILYDHHDDFIWLHGRLADEKSRNVLYAILSSWIGFDSTLLSEYKEREQPEYYIKDVFPPRTNEVFVDVGAYTGDSVANFIVTYGMDFKRIYCYEIAPDSFNALKKNLTGIPDIDMRQKAAGAAAGTMYIDFGNEVSSERVSDHGEAEIEVVSIDDDIEEPVTFIKMDIEGGEKAALQGCRRQIQENHPRLAISTYHGYDDIYAIPRLVDETAPGYKFYMRYHGGNLIPTEFSMLAVWGEDDTV